MKKIKILYYGYTSNIGGIEKYLINVYRNIDKSKFDIKFLIFKNEIPCFYDEIKQDVIYITSRRQNYSLFKKELKEILINYNFDIIHLNYVDFSCFEPAIYAKRYSNAKIILHSHIASFKIPSIKTKILNKIGLYKLIKYDDSFYKVGCSELANEYMFNKFKRKETIVLKNGINVEEFRFNKDSRDEIRKQLNVDEKCILLGNIGRMVYQKNQKFLIDILSKLNEKGLPNKYKLLIIGKGKLKEEIIEYSKEKRVIDQLIIKQDINNIYDYMSAMDLFVFPSFFEGLPIVLIEAQASGLISIASDKGISYEANITNEVKYCSLKNIDEWVKFIVNNSSQERYCKIDIIKNEYDIKNSILKLEEFYKSIVIGEKNG